MRRPPTLRGRVSGLALAVIAGWLVVLAGGFDLVLVSRINSQVDDALRVRAQAASATVVTRDGQVVAVRESATDSQLDSGIWVYAGSRAIERPSASAAVRRAADGFASAPTGYLERAGHRFYVLPVRLDGRRVGSVVASVDLDPYEDTERTVVLGSIVVGILLIAGAYPVLRLATGRALQPVDRMTRQAADWSVTAPGSRFGDEQRYAELSSLAGTLDELLDRLAAVLRHERHLSAELSHELRTPLARVTAQLDLTIADARPYQQDELAQMRDNCVAMDGIIESLLAAARSELAPAVGRCELDGVFASFVADDRAPRVVSSVTDLAVGVDPDLVVRILSPVVDNARRYAATQIALSARRVDGRVRIEVSDDGPPLDAAVAERVFEPGFRAVPDDGHVGAGLGLALARRLARSADGDLTVDTAAPRTTFVLVVPRGLIGCSASSPTTATSTNRCAARRPAGRARWRSPNVRCAVSPRGRPPGGCQLIGVAARHGAPTCSRTASSSGCSPASPPTLSSPRPAPDLHRTPNHTRLATPAAMQYSANGRSERFAR